MLFIISGSLFLISGFFCKSKKINIHAKRIRFFTQSMLLYATMLFLFGLMSLELNPAFTFIFGNIALIGFLIWMLWFSPWTKPAPIRATVEDIR